MYFRKIIIEVMFQIREKLISLDIFERKFLCNLDICKGNCCIHGDSGAPLSEEETHILENEYEKIKSSITIPGQKSIEKLGKWLTDADGDIVTPLIDGNECVYAVIEKGIARCGIENAFIKGKTGFRKPISCHLYPIRISRVGEFTALNYHQWSVCKPAADLGSLRGVPLYMFLKEAIVRAYGESFYHEMEKLAVEINNRKDRC